MTEKSMVAAGATAMADMTFSDMQTLARSIAASGLFGIKTPDQALALMAISAAEGMHPAIAARDYHIVQGRPTLKADAMLARFQTAGGIVRWTEYTDQRVTGVFSHPSSPEPVTVTWTMDMAVTAKLTGKDVWRQYPRAMLRARVVSEGIRTIYPGVCVGVYTPEEAAEFASSPAAAAVRVFDAAENVAAQRDDSDLVVAEERIAGLGLDRSRVDKFCYERFGSGISELEPAQAKSLLSFLPRMASKTAAESLAKSVGDTLNTAALEAVLKGRDDYPTIMEADWNSIVAPAIDVRWQALDAEKQDAA